MEIVFGRAILAMSRCAELHRTALVVSAVSCWNSRLHVGRVAIRSQGLGCGVGPQH